MPIIDYHCHINPKEIYENKKFENITQIWLGGDHYKWRLIRSNGTPEEEITGNAPDRVKFQRFAEALPKAIGNPMYHWTHLDPLTLIRAYPIGVIKMIDNGRGDEKINAIPFNDPTYNNYKDISQLPMHIFDEMRHFFEVYKNLEHKETAVDEVSGKEEAINIIKSAIDNYNINF